MKLNKKKILYVITKSNMGGAQRYVFDLATNLREDEFESVVAMGGSGLLHTRLAASGIRTETIQHFTRDISPLSDIGAFFELISLMRRERPDVVHLNSAKAVTLGALAARIVRVPRIIVTAHGWTSNEPRPRFQRALISIIEWLCIRLAHATIVVCAHDARPHTTTIHNGIETPHFFTREDARQKLGLPNEGYIVGTIGELTANKNQELLIHAVGTLLPANITLAIIGEGELRAPLETARATYPTHDIRLLGHLPDASAYLTACNVFVLPSKKEGLPYALLEAGAAGIPIIAADIGGISEIIKNASLGTLLPTHTRDAYAQAITHCRNKPDLASAQGKNLKARIASHFTLSRMLQLTQRLY